MHAIGRHVADGIGDARLVEIDDAAHLPHLEAPAVVDALLHDLLGRV